MTLFAACRLGEEVEDWQQRVALLNELEDAVRLERQLYQKQTRIEEWTRQQNTVLLRDVLPGPGEYEIPDYWGSLSGQNLVRTTPNRSLTGSFIGANKHLDLQIMTYL